MRPGAHRMDRWLRALAARRWLLAAGLAAGAVATALPVLAPDPVATTGVLAAARDLPPGTTLAADDTTVVRLPPSSVPDGALLPGDDVSGQLLAGGVRRGEALTDVRVVGTGLLTQVRTAAHDDTLVAVPVRLADAASTALLRTGDRVDVLAATTGPTTDPPGGAPGAGTAAVVVARDCPVLAVPATSDSATGLDGALVVLATSASTAARLAGAAASSRLSVVVR